MSRLFNAIVKYLLLVIIFNSYSVYAITLRVAYGQHNNPPYANIENQQLVGGIIKDLMDALAQELNIKVVYKLVSRMREEQQLLNGDIDVVVLSSPVWLANGDQFNWSIPLFMELDQFVVATKRPFSINNFNDLKGKRLGTIRGYFYQGLMPMFEQQLVIRKDVENIGQNFNKLKANRIDAFIDSNILIQYYLKNQGDGEFQVANKVASSHFMQSAFSPAFALNMEEINAALGKMIKSGKIETILKKYQ